MRPEPDEAAPYYFRYIDRVSSDNIVDALHVQLEESLAFFSGIAAEKSLHRYAPEKWTIRQVVSHISDCERVFLFRAFWFARGFAEPLPSYDQNVCVQAAGANEVSWASHVEEFQWVRLATLSFFRNLSPEAWLRRGIASDNSFTVRALAYIVAGHATHHAAIIQERYL